MILEILVVLGVMAGLFAALTIGLVQARKKELQVVPVNERHLRAPIGEGRNERWSSYRNR